MIYLIVALAVSPCYLPGILLRFAHFAHMVDKAKKGKMILTYTAVFVVNIFVLAGLFAASGVSLMTIRNVIPVYGMVITFINMYYIRGRVKEHLFVCGLVLITTNLLVNLTMFFSISIWDAATTESYLYGNLISIVLMSLTYVPLKKLMCKTIRPFIDNDFYEYWKGIWIIPLALYFAMYIGATTDPVARGTVKFLVSRVLFAVVTFSICYGISHDHKLAQRYKDVTEQLGMQKSHYADMELRVADARKKAHDFKHHIAVIQHYIDTNDRDGLQEYCWRLGEKQIGGVPIPYTGNSAVDGVMYRYAQLANDRDVEFEYVGSIGKCAMENMDLAVLMGNALDNALAGCMRLEENRKIHVVMQTEQEMISVVVHNTFDGIVQTAGEQLLSRKRDNEPGVGMSSMQTVCDKYGATMDYKWDEDSFTVLFMIPVECRK